MIEEKKYLRDDVASIIFTDASLHEYVELVVSKALNIDLDIIKNNLILRSPKVYNNISNKKSIVDAVYEMKEGVINIEINYCCSKKMKAKNMRYICELALSQVPKGAKDKLKPIYQININNFDIFNKGKFVYRSLIIEEEIHEVRDKSIVIVDIDVDFLSKLDYTRIKEEETDSLEKLLYIFVCNNKERLDEVYIGNEIMKSVRDKISALTEDFADNLYYDREEYINAVSEEVGEQKKAIEIAKKMLEKHIDIKTILDCTGLSEEEVKSLKEN